MYILMYTYNLQAAVGNFTVLTLRRVGINLIYFESCKRPNSLYIHMYTNHLFTPQTPPCYTRIYTYAYNVKVVTNFFIFIYYLPIV